MLLMTHSDELSAYMTFGRSDWAALRSNPSLTLSDADLSALRGLNEPITSAEVADVYLPLTRLLNLHFSAARNLMRVKAEFLGRSARGSPKREDTSRRRFKKPTARPLSQDQTFALITVPIRLRKRITPAICRQVGCASS